MSATYSQTRALPNFFLRGFVWAFLWIAAPALPGEVPADLEYRRPLPESPKVADPSTLIDLFSYSLAYQMHATLFRFDESYAVTSYLVKAFEVSRDQKTYQFTLRAVRFHDGTLLNAGHVVASLENALRRRANNHAGFRFLVGYSDFVDGKSPHLAGLVQPAGAPPDQVKMVLTEADPDWLGKLTDLGFSIWDQKNPANGLGPFRLESQGPTEVVLKRADNGIVPTKVGSPTGVRLTVMKRDDAVACFRKGRCDDLFFYSVPEADIVEYQASSHVQSVKFPRTCYLALNARNVADPRLRSDLVGAVVVADLVESCFTGDTPTYDLMPPGFIGHLNAAGPTKEKVAPKKSHKGPPLKIAISESIGGGKCLADYLRKTVGAVHPIEVSILPISKIVPAWRKSEIDGVAAFNEGTSSLDYFGDFAPKSNYPLGNPHDKKFEPLLQRFLQAPDPEQKQKTAGELATHILEEKTFLPLFHPKIYFVYHRRFKKLTTPFKAAALLPITEFVSAAGE